MKTLAFKGLVEAAIRAEYDLESDFDKVPYLDSDGTSTVARECIGVFLHDGVHMASVAARAMYMIFKDDDGLYLTDADKDEAMGDFVEIMGGMRVAPYMQWHCAYFPGLTMAQVERDEAVAALPAEAKSAIDELEGMLESSEVQVVGIEAAIEWVIGHADDVVAYRNNGMRFDQIADTVLNLARGADLDDGTPF